MCTLLSITVIITIPCHSLIEVEEGNWQTYKVPILIVINNNNKRPYCSTVTHGTMSHVNHNSDLINYTVNVVEDLKRLQI